ncbi:hypothetical protein RHGRI_001881 [Rhododendron griersonianum]|uniref:Uncharacterized protein n=1 Tax=Rhododendron griersonianum TaxID=479676 RepID=A0AAV6LME9_9ERIC|nr:hypothetical protein RHGRI_001881 [Rhododendron griersonianum]
MAVYVGTSLAKKFLKYINAPPSSSKNIAPEGSQTISDYGFREFDQSDGEKEVEQPVPVAVVPLQSVPPLTTFKRKRHTKALASISEEPSMILSSPKRRKALIPDSDDETVSYPGTGRMTRSKQEAKEQERAEEEEKERKEAELDDDAKISSFARKRPSHRSSSAQPSNISLPHQSPSHEVPTTKLIIENPNSMVDLNQVGNPGDFIEPSNVSTLNTENPADSPLGVPEILSTKSLETPLPQVDRLGVMRWQMANSDWFLGFWECNPSITGKVLSIIGEFSARLLAAITAITTAMNDYHHRSGASEVRKSPHGERKEL